ncbi:MAG: DUF58 domain-containing protein [Treponema sp.]|nr:DUF58 domain-containing protein [Treponema sp.]
MLITCLAFAAGHIRNELALTLLGAVFLTILLYCFAAVFLLSLLHRRRLPSISANVITKTVETGKNGELRFTAKGRFFRFPGVLVRYELKLETRDGRMIRCIFDPGPAAAAGYNAFAVGERGAYYGPRDELAVFDVPGFFRISFPVPQGDDPRLLAVPLPAEESISFPVRSGGAERRSEPRYRRTEDLTDHRPYIPGDDPRRINWKLYGHAGDLFVREGEPEPPPHSRLVILLDTQADPGLYNPGEGRRAVDLLCRSALAAALEFSGQGIEVSIGHTGGKIRGGNPQELAPALAWPAALPMASPPDLPALPEHSPPSAGILILALPRSYAEPAALDRFLRNLGPGKRADLFFIYGEEHGKAAELKESAEICAALYGRKPGIRAHYAGAPGAGSEV